MARIEAFTSIRATYDFKLLQPSLVATAYGKAQYSTGARAGQVTPKRDDVKDEIRVPVRTQVADIAAKHGLFIHLLRLRGACAFNIIGLRKAGGAPFIRGINVSARESYVK